MKEKSGFQLRSGNGTAGSSFKMMGASPAKEMDPMYNGQPGVQQSDFEQFSKDSPAKFFVALGKGVQFLSRAIRGTKKYSRKNLSKVKNVKDELTNTSLQTKNNQTLTKKSKEIVDDVTTKVNKHNRKLEKKSIRYGASDLTVDGIIADAVLNKGRMVKGIMGGGMLPEVEVKSNGNENYNTGDTTNGGFKPYPGSEYDTVPDKKREDRL